MTKVKL